MLRTLTVAAVLCLLASPWVIAQEKVTGKPATKPAEKVAAKPDQKYDIRLHRPSKVGDTFKIEAVGATRKRTLITIDGKEGNPLDELIGVSVEGTVKVLEVAPSGVETKLSLNIDGCVASVGKQQVPLLPKGTVVVATWDKEKKSTVFTLDGKAMPDEVDELLELALNAGDPESLNDDEIFGTKEKRQVGDSWPINAAAAAKEFTRVGLKTREEDLYGETTVVAQSDVDGVSSLQLKTEFKARSLVSDDKGEGKLKLASGNLVIATGVTLPVDPSLHASKAVMKMKLTRELMGKGEDGKEFRAVETVDREWERIIRPAGK